MLNFKKLDNNCYYVTDGINSINVYVRYSSTCKHYEVDVCDYYFECKNLKEMKSKVEGYWNDDKLNLF